MVLQIFIRIFTMNSNNEIIYYATTPSKLPVLPRKLLTLFLCCLILNEAQLVHSTPQSVHIIPSYSSKNIKKEEFYRDVFPADFKWGLSSSAFQIEGAWNEDGKGESIWDELCHNNPEKIADKSNADVACDSYHKYKEDVKLVKSVGANIYRFSISWPRILPKGTTEILNKDGINYYNNLINELIAQGIEPMICLFHWDLPQNLQEGGGWVNEEVIGLFGDYARLIFQNFGDRVKYWITMNEPYTFCYYGYDQGIFAPGVRNSATGPYACVHSLLKAHALAYHIYKEEFKPKQQGKVGIALDNFWQEPADPNSAEDKKAAEQSYLFRFGWIAYPLFRGEYPPIMRKIIDSKSKDEKRKESRLPKFDSDWVKRVNGSVDFLGINHFTSQLVTFSNKTGGTPDWESDSQTLRFYDPSWPATGSKWLKVVPEGLRKALNKIKEDFGNPEVIITENGVSDQSAELEDSINDNQRVDYHRLYINEVLKAVKVDGCNVKGYFAWSLLDGFEWSEGYTEKFGIFHVDHKSANRTRTPKKSAKALQKIFTDNGFPHLPISFQRVGAISIPATEESSNYHVPAIILVTAPLAVVYSAYYAYSHV